MGGQQQRVIVSRFRFSCLVFFPQQKIENKKHIPRASGLFRRKAEGPEKLQTKQNEKKKNDNKTNEEKRQSNKSDT